MSWNNRSKNAGHERGAGCCANNRACGSATERVERGTMDVPVRKRMALRTAATGTGVGGRRVWGRERFWCAQKGVLLQRWTVLLSLEMKREATGSKTADSAGL